MALRRSGSCELLELDAPLSPEPEVREKFASERAHPGLKRPLNG